MMVDGLEMVAPVLEAVGAQAVGAEVIEPKVDGPH